MLIWYQYCNERQNLLYGQVIRYCIRLSMLRKSQYKKLYMLLALWQSTLCNNFWTTVSMHGFIQIKYTKAYLHAIQISGVPKINSPINQSDCRGRTFRPTSDFLNSHTGCWAFQSKILNLHHLWYIHLPGEEGGTGSEDTPDQYRLYSCNTVAL